MDFSTAVQTCFSKFIDFTGRARRSEYWYFFLFSFLLQLVLDIVVGSDFASGIVTLGLFIPTLAVGARRLHDTGRSGWWQLLWLIPLLGWIVLLIFMVKRGDVGTNHHGYDPLDRTVDPHEPAEHDMDANPAHKSAPKSARRRSRRDAEGRDIDGDDSGRGDSRRDDSGRNDNEGDDASNEDNPWVKVRRKNAEADKTEVAKAEEAQKKITEEKKRRIEPPKFGRDAAKKD